MLVQRLQKDILPKIESQIAELAKQDEPTEATKAISKQLKVTVVSNEDCFAVVVFLNGLSILWNSTWDPPAKTLKASEGLV